MPRGSRPTRGDAGDPGADPARCAVILGTGMALFLFVGLFWMPLAIFMFCYYFGSILVVGNTPGVCLAASASDPPC